MRTPSALAALVAAAALAGCGASHDPATASDSSTVEMGRPIATAPFGPTSTARAAQHVAPTSTKRTRAPAEHIQLPPTPQTTPTARGIRRIATTFAQAYLAYQVGHDSPPVLAGLRATCTPKFAAELISQPASVPPAQRNNPAFAPATVTGVTYGGLASFRAGRPLQIVLAGYRTNAQPPVRGTLVIELSQGSHGWRVTGVRPQ